MYSEKFLILSCIVNKKRREKKKVLYELLFIYQVQPFDNNYKEEGGKICCKISLCVKKKFSVTYKRKGSP